MIKNVKHSTLIGILREMHLKQERDLKLAGSRGKKEVTDLRLMLPRTMGEILRLGTIKKEIRANQIKS